MSAREHTVEKPEHRRDVGKIHCRGWSAILVRHVRMLSSEHDRTTRWRPTAAATP
jgi:hypothetical protein